MLSRMKLQVDIVFFFLLLFLFCMFVHVSCVPSHHSLGSLSPSPSPTPTQASPCSAMDSAARCVAANTRPACAKVWENKCGTTGDICCKPPPNDCAKTLTGRCQDATVPCLTKSVSQRCGLSTQVCCVDCASKFAGTCMNITASNKCNGRTGKQAAGLCGAGKEQCCISAFADNSPIVRAPPPQINSCHQQGGQCKIKATESCGADSQWVTGKCQQKNQTCCSPKQYSGACLAVGGTCKTSPTWWLFSALDGSCFGGAWYNGLCRGMPDHKCCVPALSAQQITDAIVEAVMQVASRRRARHFTYWDNAAMCHRQCLTPTDLTCFLPWEECMHFTDRLSTVLKKKFSLPVGHAARDAEYDGWGNFKQYPWSARGCPILSLNKLADDQFLQPGMLIYTRSHWWTKPYNGRGNDDDGNHWAMYVGKINGVHRFVDNVIICNPSCDGSSDISKCTRDASDYSADMKHFARRYGCDNTHAPNALISPPRVNGLYDPLYFRRSTGEMDNLSNPTCAQATPADTSMFCTQNTTADECKCTGL